MVSIAVILVTVVGALSAHLTSRNLMRTAHETDMAVADLQAAMERVMLLSPDLIPVGNYPAGQSIAAFDDLHLRQERIVPTYPGFLPGGAVPDPLQVTLTATWRSFEGRTRTLTLSCAKTR